MLPDDKESYNEKDFEKNKQNNLSKSLLENEEPSSLRVLEAKLKYLENLIEKCSREEMSLTDMETESSAYIKEDCATKKYMDCWKQYMNALRRKDGRSKLFKKLKITKSKHSQINDAVKLHLVKKRKFPDYPEILEIVFNANKEFQLNLNPSIIQYESSEIFFEVGTQLQKDRRRTLAKNLKLYLPEDSILDDPSSKDAELNIKLKEVNDVNQKEMEHIFSEYSELGIMSQAIDNDKQQIASSPSECGLNEAINSNIHSEKSSSSDVNNNDCSIIEVEDDDIPEPSHP